MKVAVCGNNIYRGIRRGTAKSLIDLYLTVYCHVRPDWECVLLHRGRGVDDPFAGLANFRQEVFDTWGDRWHRWQRKALPRRAARIGADVLHCPANTGPEKSKVPVVLTIHDLIPLEPGLETPNSEAWSRRVGKAARAATRIITPSSYSRQRIVETFGLPADKVSVVYWAPNAAYVPVEDESILSAIRERYTGRCDGRYILAFSGNDRRKNATGILDAYARLSPDIRNEFELVMVGMPEAVRSRMLEQHGDTKAARTMQLHGFAPEEDMAGLISAATALCYPTLAEGFGLPVLDAFQCRTAVLAGNTTSVPEVAGDAALLVDPYDVDAVTAGLERLLTDEAFRTGLVERGARRAEQFTWRTTAEKTIAVFEEAAGRA